MRACKHWLWGRRCRSCGVRRFRACGVGRSERAVFPDGGLFQWTSWTPCAATQALVSINDDDVDIDSVRGLSSSTYARTVS